MALPKVLHIMGAPIVTLVDEPDCPILVHEKRSLANIWHSWLIQLDATTHVRQPCVTAMAPRVTMVQTAYTMCADHPLLPPRSWRLIPAPALLPRPGPASSPPSAFSSPPYLALLTLLALGRPIILSTLSLLLLALTNCLSAPTSTPKFERVHIQGLYFGDFHGKTWVRRKWRQCGDACVCVCVCVCV